VFKLNVAMARAAGLDKNEGVAAKFAKEVFGETPNGTDSLSITAELTETLKIRVHAKGKVIGFAARAGELGKAAK
jgi:hypothetical protein